MPTIPPDAVVRGHMNRPGNQVSLDAMLWCLRGAPSGLINGSIQRVKDGQPATFRFQSQSVTMLEAMMSPRSVAATFDNLTLQENTYTPITGCRAYLTAMGIGHNMWMGSLVIIRPDGQPLFVHGQFMGELQIIRQVIC